MRRIAKLASLLLALLLAGAALPGALAEAEAQDDWTVLIYLCGSDLESRNAMATYNLREISLSRPPTESLLQDFGRLLATDVSRLRPVEGRVNVLIETGGCAQWHAKEELGLDIAADRLQRYVFDPVESEGFQLLDEQPLASMGEAQTLSDFIRWGVAARPAQKYALILWDHGGGSRTGLFADELFDGDYLALGELSEALAGGGARFDALVIDACLMASLETAQAVAPYADYLVGSEEVAAGYGGAYRAWLNSLYYNPEYDGRQFAWNLCDSIQKKYADIGHEQASGMLTYSAIDLSKIDEVSRAFDVLFENIGAIYENEPMLFNSLTTAIRQAEHYGLGDEHMIDLGSVLRNRFAALTLDSEARNGLLSALSEAVIHTVKGPDRSEAYGLSFCYDLSMTAGELEVYAQNCHSAPYMALIDAVNDSWDAPDWVYERTRRLKPLDEESDYHLDMSVEVEDGMPRLVLTDSRARKSVVDYVLYQRDEDTGEIRRLGKDACNMVSLTPDRQVYEMDTAGKWPAVEGVHCDIEKVSENEAYVLYNIPAQMGDSVYNLRAAYLYDTTLLDQASAQLVDAAEGGEQLTLDYAGQYELYGMWEGYEGDSLMPNRNIVAFSAVQGREFQLLYPLYAGADARRESYAASEPLTIYRSMEMEIQPLPEGTYYCAFLVEDVFGREYSTDVVEMSWDGNEFRVVE